MTDSDKRIERDGGEELPERIIALARELNAPPATPRDEIWLRIQAARRKSPMDGVIPIASRRPAAPGSRWLALGAGVAALLVVGIGIGRITTHQPSVTRTAVTPSTVATATDSAAAEAKTRIAYTIVAAQHLSKVETFLTTLRTTEDIDTSFTLRARQLLSSTRLLRDAPGIDPRLRRLLSDLEDILVQVAQFDRSRGAQELDLITDGLEERQVLPRVRAAVPSDPSRAL